MEKPADADVSAATSAEILRQALLYYNAGAWNRAQPCFEAVLAQPEAGLEELAAANHYLANLCYFNNRTGTAVNYYQAALEIYRATANPAREAAVLFDLSRIYQAAADYPAACTLLERVIELDRQLGSLELKSHKIVLGAVRRKLREQGHLIEPLKGLT